MNSSGQIPPPRSWRSVIVCHLTATSHQDGLELPTTFMVLWVDGRVYLQKGTEVILYRGHLPVTGTAIDFHELVEHVDVVGTIPVEEFDGVIEVMRQRGWVRLNNYKDAHGWYTRFPPSTVIHG
jgi:hypothetical protein